LCVGVRDDERVYTYTHIDVNEHVYTVAHMNEHVDTHVRDDEHVYAGCVCELAGAGLSLQQLILLACRCNN